MSTKPCVAAMLGPPSPEKHMKVLAKVPYPVHRRLGLVGASDDPVEDARAGHEGHAQQALLPGNVLRVGPWNVLGIHVCRGARERGRQECVCD